MLMAYCKKKDNLEAFEMAPTPINATELKPCSDC